VLEISMIENSLGRHFELVHHFDFFEKLFAIRDRAFKAIAMWPDFIHI
jgi:hypothetical protein